MKRRPLLATVGLSGAITLVGCGFKPRGARAMPFTSVALVGFPSQSPLERALRLQLAAAVPLVQPAGAAVVVQALQDSRERAVVASTGAGQVREFQLRVRLQWRASTPQGRELIAPSEILLTRDLSYSEAVALAKEREAEQLYAAMDDDIAAQVVHRLSRLKMTG